MLTRTILGIDPGLNKTGWCLLNDTGPIRRLEATGVLCADESRPWFERIDAQASAFAVLLAEMQPVYCAFENFIYQGKRSHNPSALWLARLVGRFEGIARSGAREFITVDKLACNRAIGLTGKTSKDRVRKMVDLMFPPVRGPVGDFDAAVKLRPKTEHECDAIAVAVAGAQRLGRMQIRRPA